MLLAGTSNEDGQPPMARQVEQKRWRWRDVLLGWGWRRALVQAWGEESKVTCPQSPTAALEAPRTCVPWQESYLRNPACELQLCLTDLGTGMCSLHTRLCIPCPPPTGPAAPFEAPGSDVILGMTAVRTAQLWEMDVWTRLDPGLRSLLLVFTGMYSGDGSTQPRALLPLMDELPCPTLELPLDHGCVWWISEPGYPHFPHCIWIPLFQVSDLLCQQKNILFPR